MEFYRVGNVSGSIRMFTRDKYRAIRFGEECLVSVETLSLLDPLATVALFAKYNDIGDVRRATCVYLRDVRILQVLRYTIGAHLLNGNFFFTNYDTEEETTLAYNTIIDKFSPIVVSTES